MRKETTFEETRAAKDEQGDSSPRRPLEKIFFLWASENSGSFQCVPGS